MTCNGSVWTSWRLIGRSTLAPGMHSVMGETRENGLQNLQLLLHYYVQIIHIETYPCLLHPSWIVWGLLGKVTVTLTCPSQLKHVGTWLWWFVPLWFPLPPIRWTWSPAVCEWSPAGQLLYSAGWSRCHQWRRCSGNPHWCWDVGVQGSLSQNPRTGIVCPLCHTYILVWHCDVLRQRLAPLEGLSATLSPYQTHNFQLPQ